MPRFDYDIGIIGGGAAGLTVASGAAQLGAACVLIEREPKLGGDCLHYGCVPSKTLIRSAHVYHLMKRSESFGLPRIDVPPVDFAEVSARIRSVINVIQEHDSEERFCKLGAKVLFGAARFVDEHTVTVQGDDERRITAKRWVLATGSEARVPDVVGLDETPYLTNRGIFYMDRLPASLLILGGGPIAIEMAQAFTRLGSKVTVIQSAGQILPREDRDMAETLMGVLAAEGVSFRPHAETMKAKRLDTGEVELTVNVDGRTERITGERLLVAAGRKPNVERLGLENAGVEFGPGGVTVNSALQTSRKHIYAAGDITGRYLFTHAAGYEGGIVLTNALMPIKRKVDYTNFPWCTYSDPELASIGMNERTAAAEGIRYTVWTEEFRANDRALAEGDVTGLVKLLLDHSEKPIGVQILGPMAGELLSEWVAFMNARMKPSALASAVHPYPTVAEINKRVAGNFLARKIFSDRTRKYMKFFFNLKGRAYGADCE